MSRGLELSQYGSGGGAREVGQCGEVFLADVDLDRRRAGRRLLSAPAKAQQHGHAALDVIADQKIVRGADSHIDVRDRRKPEETPCARVGRDNLADGV